MVTYRIEGLVPGPDGMGDMTRVVVCVEGSEIVWLTRSAEDIPSRLEAFAQRMADQSATRAGVLYEN